MCIHAAIRLAEIQKTVAPGDGRSRKRYVAEDDEFMDQIFQQVPEEWLTLEEEDPELANVVNEEEEQ